MPPIGSPWCSGYGVRWGLFSDGDFAWRASDYEISPSWCYADPGRSMSSPTARLN